MYKVHNFSIQSKITGHEKKLEDVTDNQEKLQPIRKKTHKWQMMELTDLDFKIVF